jgi:hypothetical protein
MAGETVAGHLFENGICIGLKADGTVCHRRWLDIQHCTSADVDQPNIAHSGNLNSYEADQIVRKKKAQDEAWDIILDRKKANV